MKPMLFITQFEENPAVSAKINSKYNEERQMREHPINNKGTVTTVETDTNGYGDTDSDSDTD